MTATTPTRIDPATLQQVLADACAEAGEALAVEQVTDAYARRTSHPVRPDQIASALRELHARNDITRTKGPRSESLYHPTPITPEDPADRIRREHKDLQQALAILTGAANRAHAQATAHQKREDAWRELKEAAKSAQALLATSHRHE